MAEVHIDFGPLPMLGLGALVIGRSLLVGLACRRLQFLGVGCERLLSLTHRRGASVEGRFKVRPNAPQHVATWLEIGMRRIDRLSK